MDGCWDIAETTSNGEVERKRGAAAPSWKIDVRGTPSVRRTWTNPVLWERTLQGAWLEEPWLFEFWVETSGSGERIIFLMRSCSTSYPSGNQVDGSPLVANKYRTAVN